MTSCSIKFAYSTKNSQALAVASNLLPVPRHVLQISAEIGERSLKNLAVQLRSHCWLPVDVIGPGGRWVRENIVGSLLHSSHERSDLFWVLLDEGIVSNVQNAAETATAKLGQFINAEHLYVVFGTSLRRQPLGKFYHLDILEADSSVDFALDDGLGDIHAATDSGVISGGHPVVRSELVNLDLAKFADIANLLAFQGSEVRGDARVLQVDNPSERLVEKRADARD